MTSFFSDFFWILTQGIFFFFLWTLFLYAIHRLAHRSAWMGRFHLHHHRLVNRSAPVRWHWSNLFLFNDDLPSTIDLWISEVLPTLVFCALTGTWWIALFYYIWAALIQESIEHNEKIDLPILTSGRWHLIHHKSAYNYGLFTSLWDRVFGTYKPVQ